MKICLITRYLNEPFLDEFVEYYLSEGVDNIFILYDTDSTIPISDYVKSDSRIIIHNSSNFGIKQMYDVNVVYSKIRNHFTWVIFVDCDEFITCKNMSLTIRDALSTTYKDTDCIKIPWVMMSSNGLSKDPPSILQSLTRRWNHDLKHPHPNNWTKGRCRYNNIEVKCICRCPVFPTLGLHHPNYVSDYNFICVDTVDGAESQLNPFYKDLRESSIDRAFMLCYHYRIYSHESAKRKLKNNKLDGYKGNVLKFLLKSDYSEKDEYFMKKKSIAKFGHKNFT